MPAPTPAELDAVEARLRSILVPYESRLEWATIYGIPTLRKAGAKGHEWFAFVKREPRHVSFYLLPMVDHPEILDGVPAELARRRTGKSVLRFTALDDRVVADLERLVARAYGRYAGSA
jgi:hypothetical protein